MSKTEKQRLARRARRYGHMRRGAKVWVTCPLCSQRVEAHHGAFDGTVTQVLDRAVIDHLGEYHEAAS